MAAKLWKGSSGSDVKTLQTLLNQHGYNLDVDGGFGEKTYAAVVDYQKKNNLAVDGVVGTETWGSLNKQSSSQAASSTPTVAAKTYTAYDPTKDSTYQAATAAVKQKETEKPTYSDSYSKQRDELYDKIINREKFSYDAANDPLYQQMEDQYVQKGKLAMKDTMGQAAALTGGYGSSYAQSVGQQQYDAYLQTLQEQVPTLYGLAKDAYDDEGDKLAQEYSMVLDKEDDEYNKYVDAYNRWSSEYSTLKSDQDTAYQRGYQTHSDKQSAQNTAYSKLVSLIGSTGYMPSNAELQAAGMSTAEAQKWIQYYQSQQSFESGSGGGNASSDSSDSEESSGYDNEGYSTDAVKYVQQYLKDCGEDIAVDGYWGSESTAAADGLSFSEAYEAMLAEQYKKALQNTRASKYPSK